MNKIAIFFVLQFMVSAQAFPYVLGGSNLGIFGYPSHSCSVPSKPYKPYSFTSEHEVSSYNSSVKIYNINVDAYIDCINTYVENANNDIQRIRDAANDAVSDAKMNL
ncbi:MAG: hypothetical protein H8D24_06395 [Gammaproteobacteria bacterium]|uniref:Uncharacterized protein n=1 Tax=Candidatus Thiopontia autotrophica TaxID=2841688 RepID=A0A8J6NXL7_9GAMM|nr:hypothetical protein [Candidatus Thiopontia autotrophica]